MLKCTVLNRESCLFHLGFHTGWKYHLKLESAERRNVKNRRMKKGDVVRFPLSVIFCLLLVCCPTLAGGDGRGWGRGCELRLPPITKRSN